MSEDIKKDESMDINSLIKKEKNSKQNIDSGNNEENIKGLIVDNKELEEKNKPTEIVHKNVDDARNETSEYLDEQDKMINATEKIKLARKPKDQMEMVQVMNTVSAVADGSITPEEAEKSSDLFEAVGSDKKAVINEDVDMSEEDNSIPVLDDNKKKYIEIIIDKTGMGANLDFTAEERDKVKTADVIQVKEIKEVNLSFIKVKKSKKSFMDDIKEFQIGSDKVPVVFPASRFRAYMSGLSYGEMGDIALNTNNVTFDQMHKKLSVIYNKMVNPSIGEFKSFEDFLRKFAYTDIDIAVYGLLVASIPEFTEIALTCTDKKCGKTFEHKYSPRELLRFDKASDQFLKTLEKIADCPRKDAKALFEESPVNNHKMYELPNSGYIIEVGVASAYDYLYKIIDNTLGDKFKEEHPDDVNNVLRFNTVLLSLVDKIYVPNGNEYIEYTEAEDIINALYYIKPDEIAMIVDILQKYGNAYSTTFEFRDIQCPHCGYKTELIPININDLVFLKYQQLMNTTVDVNNIIVN